MFFIRSFAAMYQYINEVIATLTTYINEQDTAQANYTDAQIAALVIYIDEQIAAHAFLSRFSVRRTTSQSIPFNTLRKIQFNVEDYDNNSEYDHVTDFVWTCKEDGIYNFGSCMSISSLIDKTTITLEAFKNGTIRVLTDSRKQGDAGKGFVNISGDVPVVVDDTIEIQISYNKNTGSKYTGTEAGCRFWGHRVI